MTRYGLPTDHYRDEAAITLTYDTNGFRNSLDLTDWEIAVIGDSFVELGFLPDEELVTSHLARLLGVRVKNLGVSDTGLLTYNHYLKSYATSPATRHVMVFF